MAKLFGTDGPRGIAVTDLTCELAMQTGRAAALVLAKRTAERRGYLSARTQDCPQTRWRQRSAQVYAR